MPKDHQHINVQHELDVYKSLKSDRAWWDTHWQGINEMCMPRNAYITENSDVPDGSGYDRIYDTTAVTAREGLANAMSSRLTPYNMPWQQWGAPPEFKDDEETVVFMQKMSEICADYKAQSTFYRDNHNVNEDRAGPGTGCLYLGKGKKNFFDYKHIELGSYCFTEGEDGVADSMWREFKVTGSQASQMWPNGNIKDKLAEAANGGQAGDIVKKFNILHIVRPRKDHNPRMIDRGNLPYEEIYICIEDENVIETGGYESFPFMVSRFQKWGNSHVWGVSPARKAMPAIHQANFLQEMRDELVELQVRPRFKQMASMVGQVDLRAGGRTLGQSSEQLESLKEWMTSGNVNVADHSIEAKQADIKALFFQSLWEGIGNISKDMTAEEVRERRRQDELMFSPTLNSYLVDIQPLARREFQMLMENGKHPEQIPPRVIEYMRDTGEMPDPVMTIKTELTMAIERHQQGGFDRMFERLMAASQFDGSVVDHFDLAQGLREIARAEGVNERVIRSKGDVQEIQEAALEQQQQQEQMAGMSQVAEAAGKAPPELVEQAMAGV